MIDAVRPAGALEHAHAASLEIEEYDLANGMHVILHRDARMPVVALNLWYHVGSKNEHEGETGFAHLFEHMMFQGSEHVPANMHFHHVQSAGGTLNASTTFDRTNYFETLPAHRYALGLWLESDRMRSLAVTAQNLRTQRDVVLEERRSRYENQPYGTMMMELFARAYKAQPYRWPVIGSAADITAATLEQVQAFHRTYYRPENATLCLAGDLDPDDARREVDRYFAPLGNPEGEMYRPVIREAPQPAQIRDFVYDNVPLPGVLVGMHIPDMNHDDFLPLTMLSLILTSGRSSRLYRGMVYESRIAQSVVSHAYDLELPGLFILRAIASPGHGAAELEAAIWDALRDVRERGVSADEVEKACNRTESGVLNALEPMQSRANLLNSFHVLGGGAQRLNTHLDRIRAVTPEAVQRVAREWLHERNSTVIEWLPWPKDGEGA